MPDNRIKETCNMFTAVEYVLKSAQCSTQGATNVILEPKIA